MAGGRPKKQIDGIITRLARIGATEHQMAFVLDMPVGYIEENYAATIDSNLPNDYMERRLRRYYKCFPKKRLEGNYRDRRKDPGFCIECSIRAQMAYHIKNRGMTKKVKTFHALGYTANDLMAHIESQFVDGMTWDNYGRVWHIDHIRPASWFDYNNIDDDEFKKCWGLNNLQPLFASDNIRKGNRWEG